MKNRLKIKLVVFFIPMFMCLNIYGQLDYRVGKIIYMPKPCDTVFCTSGMVYGLKINSRDSVFLTINRQLICSDEKLTVCDTTYNVNDVVLLESDFFLKGCDGTIYSTFSSFDTTMYPIFDIIKISKFSLTNWNIQGFLGAYSITAMCDAHHAPYPFPENRTFIIEKGIDSDLLIYFSNLGIVRAFVTNDRSFVIPCQVLNFWLGSENFLWGKGVIRNDSICLSYVYGSIATFPPYNDQGIFWCDNCNQNTNIVLLSANQNKVYYNSITQTIIIDEGLQNQSLTLVLYDIQGKILLREINVSNSINIAHLPQGVYVYRLLQDNQIIYRGKVLK